MAASEGKKFETDFKQSVPKECWLYRFKDGTGNFGGTKNENVRFQATNICDFVVMADECLFLLELKSHLGSSIGFNCIRKNQIEEMAKVDHKRIKPYFIFNFREKEKTYAIEAQKIKQYIELNERKSFPLAWCEENGILIDAHKKKVRFNYNLKKFFEDAEKKTCTVKQVKDYIDNI